MLPHFLGIGAQRAETSWISLNLQRHPDIYIPPIKEVHYFDRSFKYPSPNLSANILTRVFGNNSWWRIQFKAFCKAKSLKHKMWYSKYLFGRYNDKWYASLFNHGRGKICGEITPAYSILEPEDIYKIYELMPNLKIIYILRNPIERTWSAFKHRVSGRKRQLDSYPDDEIKKLLSDQGSRLRGDYLRTLDNWQKVFPKKQFFIGFLDEIINNRAKKPKIYLERIYKERINASAKEQLPKKYKEYLT